MANKSVNVGMVPKGMAARANRYVAGGAIYPGDPVKLDSSGRVVVAAASDALCGAAASYASGAGVDVLVFDDPNQLFVIMEKLGGVAAQTDLNLNYNFSAGSNTTYKVSRATLDDTTGGTSSILPLKALAIEQRAGDDGLGSQAKLVVRINNHQLDGGTGTVGT